MNDSWIYQGRQSHGWFGHGTSPNAYVLPSNENGELFDPDGIADRVRYALSSILGHVHRGQRGRWAAALDQSSSSVFESAVIAWHEAAALGRDEFQQRLLDPYTSDTVLDGLRLAADRIVTGRTYQDLAVAGEHLATAAQRIGVDRWPRFIADAANRAAHAEDEDRARQRGPIRVLSTVYTPARASIDRVATGDYHLDFKFVEAELVALIHSVVEQGRLTIPDTSSPAVYGTRLHTMLAKAILDLKIPGLTVEEPFLDGKAATYGEVGTVRADIVLRDLGGDVVAVWDWKTGMFPSMSKAREKQIVEAVGDKYGKVPVGIISTRLGIIVKPVP